MSEDISIEHQASKKFLGGWHAEYVSEIIITLSTKQHKRLDRMMGLRSIHWPSRKRRTASKAKKATENVNSKSVQASEAVCDMNNKSVQVSETMAQLDSLDEPAFNDDLSSSTSELTPEQTTQYEQLYQQYYEQLSRRLRRRGKDEFSRIKRQAREMAKLNLK